MVLPRVCRALNGFLDIKFPTDALRLLTMSEDEIIFSSHIFQMSKMSHQFNPIWDKNGKDKPVYVCRKNSNAFNIQGVVDSSMRYMLT